MDERTFGEMISGLSTFFERTPPKKATFDVWFEEVKDIPNKFVNLLTAEVKKLETWPRNLPAFLRGKAAQMVESDEGSIYKIHDRRFRPHLYAKPDCQKCKGKGLYDFHMDWPIRRDEDGKIVIKHVVRPALCECTDSAEYGF